MSQFNSRDQVAFNTDAEPFVRHADGTRGGWELLIAGDEAASVVVDPRPEFTPNPHNPTSILLTEFRAMHGAKRGRALADAAIAWRGNLGVAVLNGVYTTAEAVHASRVFTRIAERHLVTA